MTESKSNPGTIFIILIGIGIASIVIGFVRHGQKVESDFVITGKTDPGPVKRKSSSSLESSNQSPTNVLETPSQSQPQTPTELVVHVAGSVKSPGVYKLPPNSRIDDAIESAGGAKPDADLDSINLAAKIEDGAQIFLAKKGQAPPRQSTSTPSSGSRHVVSHDDNKPAKLSSAGNETININRAGADELAKLPGVGPSTADKILQHRKEIGGFKNVEELLDISGIGEKKFEKMKPFVRVN